MVLDVIKKLTAEEAESGRRTVLETKLGPVVKAIFDKNPNLISSVLMIAQHRSDEAQDAIKMMLPFSISTDPDFEFWLSNIDNEESQEDWPARNYFIEGERASGIAKVRFTSEGDPHYMRQVWDAWSGNDDFIPLFAAFCKEGGVQVESHTHNYAPFAIFRRGSDGADIEIEIIGSMLRPWLDGVMPLAEQIEGNFPEMRTYAESLKADFPAKSRDIGPVRLEKFVWSRIGDAQAKVLIGVQNSMDRLSGPKPSEPDEAFSELDALKLILGVLALIFLFMLISTFLGFDLPTE